MQERSRALEVRELKFAENLGRGSGTQTASDQCLQFSQKSRIFEEDKAASSFESAGTSDWELNLLVQSDGALTQVNLIYKPCFSLFLKMK